jgi:hypothetical protein
MLMKLLIKRWWWLILIIAAAVFLLLGILQTQKRLKKINHQLENEIIHLKIKNHENNLLCSSFNYTAAGVYCL